MGESREREGRRRERGEREGEGREMEGRRDIPSPNRKVRIYHVSMRGIVAKNLDTGPFLHRTGLTSPLLEPLQHFCPVACICPLQGDFSFLCLAFIFLKQSHNKIPKWAKAY